MSKEDIVNMSGVVIDKLPGTKFKVKLDNGAILICTISGKLRINNITILIGDIVDVEISIYDASKGRIVWRNK